MRLLFLMIILGIFSPHLKDDTLIDGVTQLVGHHDALVAVPDLLRLEVLLRAHAILGLLNVPAGGVGKGKWAAGD